MSRPAGGLRLEVAPPVLAALVDLLGPLPPGARAARARLGEALPLPASAIERLVSLGVLAEPRYAAPALSPAFVAAAGVLLAPRTELTVRAWSPSADLTTHLRFPGQVARGGGVSLTPAGARYRLVSPVSEADVAALVRAAFLDPVGPVEAQTFRALLEPMVATAFFGILDWVRAGEGAPAGSPDDPAAVRIEPEAVRRHVAGPSLGSPRCFAPYLALALGRRLIPDPTTMAVAVARLVAAGALVPDGAGHRLGGILGVLASPRAVIDAALHWHERADGPGTAPRVATRVVLSLSRRLLLALDAAEDGVLVTAPATDEVAGALIGAAGPGPAAAPRRSCPGCGAAVRPGVAFCTACGRRLD